jgi:hypothetical protein
MKVGWYALVIIFCRCANDLVFSQLNKLSKFNGLMVRCLQDYRLSWAPNTSFCDVVDASEQRKPSCADPH